MAGELVAEGDLGPEEVLGPVRAQETVPASGLPSRRRTELAVLAAVRAREPVMAGELVVEKDLAWARAEVQLFASGSETTRPRWDRIIPR